MSAVKNTNPTIAAPSLAAIESRQRAARASGDFAMIGHTLQIVGETLAEAADVCAGERVLDIAAGNGNVTLASDGALPYADGSFDVALSTFGMMFAPDHAKTATEALRVIRKGGRIGMANWTPEGFVGELFTTVGRQMPPPAGLASPALWGTEPYMVQLFGRSAEDIRCHRRMFNFRYESPAHWIRIFREFFGPVHKAFAGLPPAGRARFEADLTELLERHDIGGPGSLVVPGEYLETVIVKH